MRLFMLLLFYCLSLSANTNTNTSAIKWQLAKQKQGISVYQSKQSKDHIHLKANMKVNGCINAFIGVFLDTDNAPLWLANVIKVEVLASPNPSEHLVYTQINAPWPIKDRDMVTYSTMTKTLNTQLTISIQGQPQKHPPQSDFERIRDLSANWNVEQMDDQQLMIEYQVKIKPAGNIPLWLGKSVAKSNTFSTFKQLKKRLQYYSCG